MRIISAGGDFMVRRSLLVCFVVAVGVLLVPWATIARAETYVYQQDPASGQSANGDLWVKADDAAPRLLPIWGSNPALDPTATRIVYSNQGGLYLTDLQGATPLRAIDTASQCLCRPSPQWYPDGQSIITDGVEDVYGSLGIAKATPNGGVWNTRNIIEWPGTQMAPSVSPDSSKIAFLSYTKPNGDSVSTVGFHPALFVANADGSNPIQLTTPDYDSPGFLALSDRATTSFSPDGQDVAVAGYDQDDSYQETYSVDAASGSQHQVTSAIFNEDYPDWLPSGRIAYQAGADSSTGNNGQFQSVQSDGSDQRAISPLFNHGELLGHISGPQPTSTADRPSHAALLNQYAPQLRYDSQETFFADSASEITDYAGEVTGDSGNVLRSASGTPIAGHSLGLPTLSLDFLNSGYPNGTGASDSDNIDETQSGSGYSLAANYMRRLPGYADRTYGRVVSSGSVLWLQYWFFYYDNPFAPVLGRGSHEGDWEMIQISLDRSTLIPLEAVYSQHDSAEKCAWNQVAQQTYGNDRAPVDYVAAGSHANYFTPGTHGGVAGVGADNANGDLSPPVRPTVSNVNYVPGWMFWPGKWGSTTAPPAIAGSIPTGADSPRGPVFHDQQWNRPAEYAANADPCTVPQSGGAASRQPKVAQQAPQAPTISAHLNGRRALIHYRLSRIGHAAQGRALLLTIEGTGPGDTPIGTVVRLGRDMGTRQFRLPIGRAPFIVRASVLSRQGARSPITSMRLARRG